MAYITRSPQTENLLTAVVIELFIIIGFLTLILVVLVT